MLLHAGKMWNKGLQQIVHNTVLTVKLSNACLEHFLLTKATIKNLVGLFCSLTSRLWKRWGGGLVLLQLLQRHMIPKYT